MKVAATLPQVWPLAGQARHLRILRYLRFPFLLADPA